MLFKFQLVSLMPLRNESELYLFQHDVELFIPLPRILRSAVSVRTEKFDDKHMVNLPYVY